MKIATSVRHEKTAKLTKKHKNSRHRSTEILRQSSEVHRVHAHKLEETEREGADHGGIRHPCGHFLAVDCEGGGTDAADKVQSSHHHLVVDSVNDDSREGNASDTKDSSGEHQAAVELISVLTFFECGSWKVVYPQHQEVGCQDGNLS